VIYNGITFEEQSQSLGTYLLSERVQFNSTNENKKQTKKKKRGGAPLLGLAKSICYSIRNYVRYHRYQGLVFLSNDVLDLLIPHFKCHVMRNGHLREATKCANYRGVWE